MQEIHAHTNRRENRKDLKDEFVIYDLFVNVNVIKLIFTIICICVYFYKKNFTSLSDSNCSALWKYAAAVQRPLLVDNNFNVEKRNF